MTAAPLPRMTEGQCRRARRLIRRHCANFSGGDCLLLNDPCPQLITPALICRYFCSAVLPADQELYAGVMAQRPTKRCRVCGAPIFSRSNAAKYCPRCAVRERRRQDRERKQKALHFRK